LVSRPPKVDGICDLTGEKLIHRDDDKIDVVENRFKIYKETKDEILNFYGVENTICIDADKDPSSVYEELINNLN
jgi:adenylate kinase